jgi:valyl-tRNA synthetase
MVALEDEIRRVGRIGSMEALHDPGDVSGNARLMVQGAELLIPLAGVLDPEAECTRIRERLASIGADAEGAARKLDNPGFTGKAPAEVVAKQRQKLTSLEQERAVLESQLVELGCSGGPGG